MKQLLSSMLRRQWIPASLVSLICLAAYLMTMCRSVSFIDAGELAAVASLLGVAHPTGYPFFSIVARTFLWIPIGGEEILQMNLLSAITVAASVGVFYHLVLAVSAFAERRRQKDQRREAAEAIGATIAAAIGSLSFGLSTTVWSQSVTIEVYGLHLLLVLLVIFALVKGLAGERSDSQVLPPALVLAAFLLGLSFSNHMTTLLVVPAFVYLFVRRYGINKFSIQRATKLFPFFLIGLSTYLYLPLRAQAHPPVNWGYAAEGHRMLWHISGKQYRNWMFSSFASAEKQLSYFFNHFHEEFNWLLILVLIVGLWKMYRSSKEMFWFLVIAFASCLFYSINYDIHDIDSYFMLAYIVSGIFISKGLASLIDSLTRSAVRGSLIWGSLALLLLPASQFVLNRPHVDESDNTLPADYTQNILRNIDSNAVIFTYQWDYFVSPALYYQLVRGERPDVVVIDKELLRRSWYFVNLQKRFPWLMDRCRTSVDAFLAELDKFEHDLPYDPLTIETRYVAMINDMISRSMEDRPVYLGPEIEPEFGSGLVRTPSGLLFRLVRPGIDVDVKLWTIEYRPASIETRLTGGIRSMYAKMLTATGAHFSAKNRPSDAIYCIEKALQVDPTYQPARSLRSEIAPR